MLQIYDEIKAVLKCCIKSCIKMIEIITEFKIRFYFLMLSFVKQITGCFIRALLDATRQVFVTFSLFIKMNIKFNEAFYIMQYYRT